MSRYHFIDINEPGTFVFPIIWSCFVLFLGFAVYVGTGIKAARVTVTRSGIIIRGKKKSEDSWTIQKENITGIYWKSWKRPLSSDRVFSVIIRSKSNKRSVIDATEAEFSLLKEQLLQHGYLPIQPADLERAERKEG